MQLQQVENRLSELELIIEKNQNSFYEVGKALREIRDKQFYLNLGYDGFLSYTKRRFDFQKSHCYRLMDAADVLDNLSPIGDILPENEFQVRPLTKLDPQGQKMAWQQFINTDMKLTANNITKFVASYLGNPPAPTGLNKIKIIDKSYKSAVMAMLDQIRMAQNDRWASTTREAALYWNKIMKEKILWRVK